MSNTVRWNLVISRETDIALRTHLAQQGMRKGDLSRFVEEAVRWRVLDDTAQKVKARNRGTSTRKIQEAVDAALVDVRSSSRRR